MSEGCIGCKSLRYNYKSIPYCVSIATLRCLTIKACPCRNCLVKMICFEGCNDFEMEALNYENSVNSYLKDKYAGGIRIKRKGPS